MRLFGIDPVSLERELANQQRLNEFALQRLRIELEAVRRTISDLAEHRSLLTAEADRLEAEQRALLGQFGQALARHQAQRRTAEESFAHEAAGHEERVRELTEQLRRCGELEEKLLQAVAGLVGPFVTAAPGKEAGHA